MLVGKGILFQQCRYCGLILPQPLDEARKPKEAPWVLERGEPHLPVQTRLVRDVPERFPRDIARLVPEFVFAPFDAVIRALNNDFVAFCGHDCEQAVRTSDMQGPDEAVDR